MYTNERIATVTADNSKCMLSRIGDGLAVGAQYLQQGACTPTSASHDGLRGPPPHACMQICKISLSRREDFKLCPLGAVPGPIDRALASCSLKTVHMANSNRNMIDLHMDFEGLLAHTKPRQSRSTFTTEARWMRRYIRSCISHSCQVTSYMHVPLRIS
jgi:hypothetical protein